VVPAWRLGDLLRTERERSGRTIEQLAAAGPGFAVHDLAAVEAGARPLDDHELDQVLARYGVERHDLVPDRNELVVDLDHHELAAAGHTQPLAGTQPTPDEVLGTYLTLLYTLRASSPGTPLRLRQADVDVLARALALAVSEVQHRLEDLMSDPDPAVVHQRARVLRARVLLPAAGVLVAMCVGGALVVSTRSSSNDTQNSRATTTTTTVAASSTTTVPGSTSTSTPSSVVTGNDLHHDQIPPGDVGLAPAQVVTPGANGQPVQSNRGDGSTTTTTP
jgi:hypothetical protein